MLWISESRFDLKVEAYFKIIIQTSLIRWVGTNRRVEILEGTDTKLKQKGEEESRRAN